MQNPVLKEARSYLINSLRGKDFRYETHHSWRKGWEFVVLHSLRVEAYVRKILAQEQHGLSDDEITTLRLAAILHDVSRLEDRENHASRGAKKISTWLEGTPHVSNQIKDQEKLLTLIAAHSDKESPETDFSRGVLKDADMLDEIGVLSTFMASNWVDNNSPFFFHQLLERLLAFEIPFCERKFGLLHTHTARSMLIEKVKFIETFIAQLRTELDGTHDISFLVSDEP